MTRGVPAGGDADLAAVAGLLGDRARSRMLLALTGGRELAAGLLADEAGVSRSTASEHLRWLVEGGLVSVRAVGRNRHYRLANDRVAAAIEQLIALAPAQPVTSLSGSRRADRLRVARTCYDHLAGRVGVGIMRGMLDRGLLTGGPGLPELDGADTPASPGHDYDYRLTEDGHAHLDALGVRLPAGRRPLIRYCVDWTETRHHLAGRLGRGLRDRALEAGWVRPLPTYRALEVTAAGATVLADAFGVRLGA